MRVLLALYLALQTGSAVAAAANRLSSNDPRSLPVQVDSTANIERRQGSGSCPPNTYVSYPSLGCVTCARVDTNSLTCTSKSATSCKPGYLLSMNGSGVVRCLRSCPEAQYKSSATECTRCADSDAKRCNAAGALSCAHKNLYRGSCLADCPSGSYTVYGSHVCTSCANFGADAVTCNARGATSCKNGRFLLNGQCLDACPSTHYGDKNTLQCVACTTLDENARTCRMTLSAGTAVTACQNDFGLSGGACFKPCPVRTYLSSTGVCTKCSDGDARQCTATASTQCTFTYLLNGSCVKSCPAGTYPDLPAHLCRPCTGVDANAEECSSGGATSCSTRFLQNGSCVTQCASGTFGDTTRRICAPCSEVDPNAQTCTATTVLSCSSLFLNAGRCTSTCPTGTFGNTATKACSPCRDGALQCTGADNDTVCGRNAAGQQLYLQGTYCTATCVDGFFPSSANNVYRCLACTAPGMQTCTSLTRALSCKATGTPPVQYYLKGETCVTDCGINFQPDISVPSRPVCLSYDCEVGAETCSSPTVATRCLDSQNPPRFLKAGDCVTSCGSGFFGHSTAAGPVCSECEPGADTCEDVDTATRCLASLNPPVFLKYSDCISDCGQGYFGQANTPNGPVCTQCELGAETCSSTTFATRCWAVQSPQRYLKAGDCVTSCGSGFFSQTTEAGPVCTECESGADVCTDAQTATRCLAPSFLKGTDCVSNCGQGYFSQPTTPNGPVCTACEIGAEICTDADTATRCIVAPQFIAQRYLKGTDCVLPDACGAGSYGTIGAAAPDAGPSCVPCAGAGVLTCSETGVPQTCRTDLGYVFFENQCYQTYARVRRFRTRDGDKTVIVKASSELDCIITRGRLEYDDNTQNCGGPEPSTTTALDFVASNKWIAAKVGTCSALLSVLPADQRSTVACQDVIYPSSGCYANPTNSGASHVCVPATCPAAATPSQQTYMQGEVCQLTCNSGFYKNLDTAFGPRCLACGGGAATCTDANVPLTCKTSPSARRYFQPSTRTCVATCTGATYPDNSVPTDPVCSPCVGVGVTSCSSVNVATGCQAGTYALNAGDSKCYKVYARLVNSRLTSLDITIIDAENEGACLANTGTDYRSPGSMCRRKVSVTYADFAPDNTGSLGWIEGSCMPQWADCQSVIYPSGGCKPVAGGVCTLPTIIIQ